MRRIPVTAAAFLVCVAAQAQNRTAHLIDNPTSSISQNIPIAGGSLNWDEARSHFFFPAQLLPPTGGVITGIELVPNTSNTTPYERFEISFDHTQSPNLSATFASNLTNPQLVFQQTPGSIAWTGATWNTIQFATPFVYDGRSNLVMEVVKVLDRPNNATISAVSHRILANPRRADWQTPIWAYGVYGSGASMAASATTTYSTQLLIRLLWLGPPTLTIDCTRDPSRNYFHVGSTLTVTAHGNVGEAYFNALALALYPVGLPVPPLNGALWLNGGVLLGLGPLDPTGQGSSSLTIPVNPTLVGLHMYFQSLTAGAVFTLTNCVDGIVEP